MFKYRIRMFFNELKVLVLMRSGSRRAESETDPDRRSGMRGLGVGGCGWPPFDCTSRDDEEEYYGTDPRPRSLAFEEKDPKLQAGLDAVSLTSTMESGMRSPQCRICFQGPEQVSTCHIHTWMPIQCVTLTRSMCLWFYRFVINRLSSMRYRPLSWCLLWQVTYRHLLSSYKTALCPWATSHQSFKNQMQCTSQLFRHPDRHTNSSRASHVVFVNND